MKFLDLPIGSRFEFGDGNIPHYVFQNGPWYKISKRSYTHATKDMTCRVATIHVEATILGEAEETMRIVRALDTAKSWSDDEESPALHGFFVMRMVLDNKHRARAMDEIDWLIAMISNRTFDPDHNTECEYNEHEYDIELLEEASAVIAEAIGGERIIPETVYQELKKNEVIA